MSDLLEPLATLSPEALAQTSQGTIADYDGTAAWFWDGTKDHDVRQNIDALLRHIHGDGPHAILDFGCGPGRDLRAFKDLGHQPVGLEGSTQFVEMARLHSGCPVLHQDFLALDVPESSFDGIFANASLFHVPSQELRRVLMTLHRGLKPEGVLFSSNPRGPNIEGWSGQRYCSFVTLERTRAVMQSAGFVELEHYYRPPGKPRDEQPWLASVWRRSAR